MYVLPSTGAGGRNALERFLEKSRVYFRDFILDENNEQDVARIPDGECMVAKNDCGRWVLDRAEHEYEWRQVWSEQHLPSLRRLSISFFYNMSITEEDLRNRDEAELTVKTTGVEILVDNQVYMLSRVRHGEKSAFCLMGDEGIPVHAECLYPHQPWRSEVRFTPRNPNKPALRISYGDETIGITLEARGVPSGPHHRGTIKVPQDFYSEFQQDNGPRVKRARLS